MRTGTLGLLSLATLTAMACAPREQPMVDTAAEVAAIEAVRGQEVSSIMSGDTSMAYMADDIVVMPPGGPEVRGKAAARRWFVDFMAAMEVQDLNYTVGDVTVAGDWAIEHYQGSITMVPAAGGDAMTEAVKGIHIYRKGADGAWKMTMDVWNMDSAPPMM